MRGFAPKRVHRIAVRDAATLHDLNGVAAASAYGGAQPAPPGSAIT